MKLAESLDRNTKAGGNELSTSYQESAKGFVEEIDKLLVHVQLTIDPADAAIVIDGRPVVVVDKVAYAGVAAPGPSAIIAGGKIEVAMDPGAHVFSVAKSGFQTVIARESYKPGVITSLALSVTAMPGKLRVDSSVTAAAVRVDDVDVGAAPVTVERPAGEYKIEVKKSGFVAYTTNVKLAPGQSTDIHAKMVEETPITKRWWFWTTIGGAAILSGVVLVLATRPDYDGGNQGWVARPR